MRKRSGTGLDMDTTAAANLLRERSRPLQSPTDLDPLLERIGDARVVMLGEASHGTHEYYTWRSHISRRLITEKGFSFIAVEGDWPDCYQLNQYIKGATQEKTADAVLQTFDRWPTWMWGNWEIVALAEWLKAHNEKGSNPVGFYGLDVYSLWESLESVMAFVKKEDPEALETAQRAYQCFQPYSDDEGRDYASALRFVSELCEVPALELLQQMQQRRPHYEGDKESAFSAEQNALVAVNAERYYRAMLQGGGASWNARDQHMQETLERLLDFHGPDSKAIVWAHNTHIGDALYTDMADDGMYNIGQLARDRFGKKDVVLVGFGSYEGSVIAGRGWGADMKMLEVPQGRPGSWEALLHAASPENQLLLMDDLRDTPFAKRRIGHRAIGVVYNPDVEHYGNYVPSVLADRYDAFLFLDQTKALHPLRLHADSHKMPETYPFGV
jgi:erythromycin esterase-like protein